MLESGLTLPILAVAAAIAPHIFLGFDPFFWRIPATLAGIMFFVALIASVWDDKFNSNM